VLATETIGDGHTVAYLVEHLRTEAGGSAGDLSAVLVGLGPRVIPRILGRLVTEDPGAARERLLETLARFLDVAQLDLTQVLQETDPGQACHLAPILGEVGGETGVALLACLVRHREARVRREAVRALGRIGGLSAHRLLTQALRDPDPAVLDLAIGLLGTARVKQAAPALLRLAEQRVLGGRPFAVRKAAVAALGAVGDPGSISTLTALLHTRTWFRRAAGDELRRTAALALLDMARSEAREVVETGARSRRGDIRRACSAALQQAGAPAPAKD
jgi:HEAT repeat protein